MADQQGSPSIVRENRPSNPVHATRSAFIDNSQLPNEGEDSHTAFAEEKSYWSPDSDSDDEDFTFAKKEVDSNQKSYSSSDEFIHVSSPGHKRLSTVSNMLSSLKKGSKKGKGQVAATPMETKLPVIKKLPVTKDGVNDQLLDSYPDRNLGETEFPHIAPSVSTPELQHFYDIVRGRIFHAVHTESFRGGHFKPTSTPDRSVLSIILDMELSGEVSREQFRMLFNFERVWCRAIGQSKEYPILNEAFIEQKGLEVAADQLFYMFDKEKQEPLPYPLPEHMKYIDPRTFRTKLQEAAVYQDARDAAAAATATVATDVPSTTAAAISSAAADAPSNNASPAAPIAFSSGAIASSSNPLLALDVTKTHVLNVLAEYSAATSPDRVLRNAWVEISKIKGDFTAKTINKLSNDTVGLIYNYIQSEAEAKNVPMPMGSAIQQTLARLEALQLSATPSTKYRSDLYDPEPKTPEGFVSKIKRALSKEDKGDGREPQMGPGNSGSGSGAGASMGA